MTAFIFDGWYGVAQQRSSPKKGKDAALPFENTALRFSSAAHMGSCEAEPNILKIKGLGRN